MAEAKRAALTCGLICLVFLVGVLTARALTVAKARHSTEERLFADAAHLLTPWYQLDMLGAEDTRLLLDSLLFSEQDPTLTLAVAESCLRQTHDAGCALAAGIAYSRLGKPERAKLTFLSILAKAPGFGVAHAELGKVAQANGDIDLALAEFRAAFDYFDEKEKRLGLHLLVKLLVSVKRAPESVRYLPQLARLAQADGVLEDLYLVAAAYLQAHDKPKFVATMESAEDLRGKDKLASYYVLTNTELYRSYSEVTGRKLR